MDRSPVIVRALFKSISPAITLIFPPTLRALFAVAIPDSLLIVR